MCISRHHRWECLKIAGAPNVSFFEWKTKFVAPLSDERHSCGILYSTSYGLKIKPLASPPAAARTTCCLHMIGSTRTWSRWGSSWKNRRKQDLGLPGSGRACELKLMALLLMRGWGIFLVTCCTSNGDCFSNLLRHGVQLLCVFIWHIRKNDCARIVTTHCKVRSNTLQKRNRE